MTPNPEPSAEQEEAARTLNGSLRRGRFDDENPSIIANFLAKREADLTVKLAQVEKERDAACDFSDMWKSKHDAAAKQLEAGQMLNAELDEELSTFYSATPDSPEVKEALERLRCNSWRWNDQAKRYDDVRDDALLVKNVLRAMIAKVDELKEEHGRVEKEHDGQEERRNEDRERDCRRALQEKLAEAVKALEAVKANSPTDFNDDSPLMLVYQALYNIQAVGERAGQSQPPSSSATDGKRLVLESMKSNESYAWLLAQRIVSQDGPWLEEDRAWARSYIDSRQASRPVGEQRREP